MGLFSKKKPQQPKQKDVYESLAEFNEKEGNNVHAFYFSYKDDVDTWEHLITVSRQGMNERHSLDQKLGILHESKSLLDAFHDWCSQRKHGEEYFQFTYNTSERSMYKRIEKDTKEIETLLYVIIPALLSCNGELQSELVKNLSLKHDIPEDAIRNQIYELSKEGRIKREKEGRSYRLYSQ